MDNANVWLIIHPLLQDFSMLSLQALTTQGQHGPPETNTAIHWHLISFQRCPQCVCSFLSVFLFGKLDWHVEARSIDCLSRVHPILLFCF